MANFYTLGKLFGLFFILIGPFSINAQETSTKQQATVIVDLAKKLSKDKFSMTMDATKERSFSILSSINNTPKIAAIKAIKDVRLEMLTNVMYVNIAQNQKDSVLHYKKIIEETGKGNYKFLGLAETYFAEYLEIQKKNTKALSSYEKALRHLQKADNDEMYVRCLFKLTIFYVRIGVMNLAYDNYANLKKQLNNSKISEVLKNRIRLIYPSILYEDKRYKEAIASSKKIDTNLLKKDKFIAVNFYSNLSNAYLNLNELDTAMVYAKKAYKDINPSFTYLKQKNMLLSSIHIAKKEYKIAQKYIDDLLGGANQENKEKTAFYNQLFKIERSKGNYKKALLYKEKYIAITDSINSLALINKSIILNYNLKKEKEVIRLQESNKNKEVLYNNKRDSLIVIIILMVAIGIIILIAIYSFKSSKSKRLRLELNFEKKIGAEKKQFLENLSHEIRTPITIIIGYLSLIKKNSLNAANVISYSEKTIITSRHMIDSLNNFLALSRLTQTKLKNNLTSKVFSNYIKELVFSFKANVALKNQSLHFKTNLKEGVLLDFDFENLKKIIYNLISNAIKYTDTQKSIYISAFIEDKDLIFTVKDSGIGIQKEELACIFTRFYKSKNNSDSGGFGIGLSLVKELVTQMKGTINVVSEVNVGSVFTVRIPLHIKHPLLYVTALEQEAICVHEVEATSIEHSKPSLPKALIIDDNLEMIAYLKDLLSSKLDCTFAYNGVNGLALCKQEPFDLIISDYKMPQMNGFQFKAALNKLEGHKETPFIMLTANTINIEEDRYLQLGISDYIVKPFKNEELFARIHHLLENSQYLKKVENISKKEFEFTGSYSELMSDVNRIIILNITNEAFTVKVLAEECGFSQQHLTLILKSKTGLTPGKIILEVRLLKSYEYLLNNTYQTLNEVIYAVGLNSRAYFNKAFLNRFGIKPGEVAK